MLGDPSRLRELEVFAVVAAEGNFSAAARATGLTPSAVSKAVARLERRLGARLVARTTRGLTLTDEGRGFHLRAAGILTDLEAAEDEAARGGRPVGTVHVTTSASYAHHILYPAIGRLRAAHPALRIVVSETDTVVGLIEAEADIAVRAGEMPSSALVARGLGASGRMVVAAPAYLAARGTPETARDLAAHDLIGLGYRRREAIWPFDPADGGRPLDTRVALTASDGEGIRHMARAGLGLARLTAFTVRDDISAGRLVPLLREVDIGDREPFHALWLKSGGPLPARVRLVLDHLATHGRVDAHP
ncbi:LysR family transcriptional regulator [Acuticoccus sp. I52.16.1]|uniref:LysR family transcriptional regulator n=1 Tax=Acuticoccus sp. I52.16.1 TaxID=2928472 RepID=UPI001FD525C6|nr:LysR family transcriptional regulator [Acuticoccus sp. I52.16.1]UOM32843.1 LysR family transcriptional regulator [Acuticoccus sp. I52.16.1]